MLAVDGATSDLTGFVGIERSNRPRHTSYCGSVIAGVVTTPSLWTTAEGLLTATARGTRRTKADRRREGNPIVGSTLVMLLNASEDAVVFRAPPGDVVWELLVDTACPQEAGGAFDLRETTS
jgi:hypothetical protein